MLTGRCGFPQTSTYQAVLSTDGNQSFALLLYQDGGMRWDYAGLAAGNVLIGFSRCRVPTSVCVLGHLVFLHHAGPHHQRPPAQESPAPTSHNPIPFKPSLCKLAGKPTEPPSLKPCRALCAEPSPRRSPSPSCLAGSGDGGHGRETPTQP